MVKHAEATTSDSQLCRAAEEGNIEGIHILLADAEDREKFVNSNDKKEMYPLQHAVHTRT